jgi:hypothetical protein
VLTQKLTFSPSYYYEVGTSGNALKRHMISAGLSLEYLQISLFMSMYQTAVGFVSPAEFANEAFDL